MDSLIPTLKTCGQKRHYKTMEGVTQAKADWLKSKGLDLVVNLCKCGKYYLDFQLNKPRLIYSCKKQPKKDAKRIRRKQSNHCQRKTHYDTEQDAKNARFYISKRHGRFFNVYKCPVCGKWALSRIHDTSGYFMFNKVVSDE